MCSCRLESHSHKLVSRSHQIASHSRKLESHSHKLESRSNKIASRSHKLPSCSQKLESRSHKIEKCLFYSTFLDPSKIFQYVTLDWVLFGTAYLVLSPLVSHTSYVPGCRKTRVCCATNCIEFSRSKLHSLIIVNPFFIRITLFPP